MDGGQRALYLYGAGAQPEVVNFLRTQCVFENDSELEAILRDWREAANAFAQEPLNALTSPDSIRVEDVPADYSNQLEEVSRDPLFSKSFSLLPTSFKLVEIDRIVAGQRYVNMDYVDTLSKTIPKTPNIRFLIDFCLKRRSHASPPAELQTSPNVYGYKSETTDFRFLGGYPKKIDEADIAASTGGGEPVAALVLLVGYGSPQVNVFQVGTRIVLNNGFHRLVALRSRGVESAPMVVQHITNVDLELPPMIAGLPSQYLVRAPKPSMLMDFLNPKFVREVRMKSRDRSVQIQWNINQVDIPR